MVCNAYSLLKTYLEQFFLVQQPIVMPFKPITMCPLPSTVRLAPHFSSLFLSKKTIRKYIKVMSIDTLHNVKRFALFGFSRNH